MGLEASLYGSFMEGLRTAQLQEEDNGPDLEPIDLDNIQTDRDRAKLLPELIYWVDFCENNDFWSIKSFFLTKLYVGSSFKSKLTKILEEGKVPRENYWVLQNLNNIGEKKPGWYGQYFSQFEEQVFIKSIQSHSACIDYLLSKGFINKQGVGIIKDQIDAYNKYLEDFAQKLQEFNPSLSIPDDFIPGPPTKYFPEESSEIYEEMYEIIKSEFDQHKPDVENKQALYKRIWHKLKDLIIADEKSPEELELLKFALAFAADQRRIHLTYQCHFVSYFDKRYHEPLNGEKISSFVMEHYKGLKPYERDQLTDILIMGLHKFKEKYSETKSKGEHLGTLLGGGHSSYVVIKLTSDVAKFASIQDNDIEDLVYSLKDSLEYFKLFMPDERGEVLELSDGLSMLIMDDVRKKPPSGYEIATALYKLLTDKYKSSKDNWEVPWQIKHTGHNDEMLRFKIAIELYKLLTDKYKSSKDNWEVPWQTWHKGHNAAMLNMFLLGLAHKELTKAAADKNIEFPDVEYMEEGVRFYEAIKIPLPETSDRVYRNLMSSVPEELVKKSGRIIERFIRYSKDQDNKPVILDDNKIRENMCNGYIYDFATAGRGLEIEDITYGLVDKPGLSIPIQNIRGYVKAYVRMRCLHDPEFRDRSMTHERDMLNLTDAATLKSLSIYAACTRKRIGQMEERGEIARRNYFINAMQYMLEEGDFSDFSAI